MIKQKKFKDFPGNLIKVKVLEDEIEYFKTQIQEHDTGHIYTTIDTLKDRVRELKGLPEEYQHEQYLEYPHRMQGRYHQRI